MSMRHDSKKLRLVSVLLIGALALLSFAALSMQKSQLRALSSATSSSSIVGMPKSGAARSSATGSLFHGERFRAFQGERLFRAGWQQVQHPTTVNKVNHNSSSDCSKWSVVTTIFAPTEAVKRVASLPDWCLVIVADTETPADYVKKADFDATDKTIHFLSVKDQEEWALQASKNMKDFIQLIPYRHFARKNLGYLYAIQHGAQFLFDVDDDNLLHEDARGQIVSPLANETHLEHVRIPLMNKIVMNHHPLMGASIENSYPRGFPLEFVQDKATQGTIAFEEEAVSMENFGVMQFCADRNPDVDAIHRLTKPLPMSFDAPTDMDSGSGTPLMVPLHAFAPYNAQATLHTYKALWATLLPFTVSGRVSDIWRGYFSEALFRDLHLQLAFLPPKVTQLRNEHNYLADMEAEHDLYFKGGKLVEFLNGWTSTSQTVPERMEELWIDLFERGYIDANDVKLVQRWLQALLESNYQFPKVTRSRHSNVVLMGQFNFASELDDVSYWDQKWKEAFQHVVVRGPWNNSQLDALNNKGILAYRGGEDRGRYSPMENLAKTLQDYENTLDIDGVLYVHDDAYLNLTNLLAGEPRFSRNNILASKSPGETSFFADPRNFSDLALASETMYFIQKDGTWLKPDGKRVSSLGDLQDTLRPWNNYNGCLRQLQSVALDGQSEEFREADGSFIVPSWAQSDFLFVPITMSPSFSKAAQLVFRHRVFLECGFPTIVQMLRKKENASVNTTLLCTRWGRRKRGSARMLTECMNEASTSYGMYHPFKIAQGLQEWGRYFDAITFSGS